MYVYICINMFVYIYNLYTLLSVVSYYVHPIQYTLCSAISQTYTLFNTPYVMLYHNTYTLLNTPYTTHSM